LVRNLSEEGTRSLPKFKQIKKKKKKTTKKKHKTSLIEKGARGGRRSEGASELDKTKTDGTREKL